MLYQKIIGLALVSFPIAIGYLFPIGSLITHHPKISPFGIKYWTKLCPPPLDPIECKPSPSKLIEKANRSSKALPSAGLKKRW